MLNDMHQNILKEYIWKVKLGVILSFVFIILHIFANFLYMCVCVCVYLEKNSKGKLIFLSSHSTRK